jgi:hypothetical protein
MYPFILPAPEGQGVNCNVPALGRRDCPEWDPVKQTEATWRICRICGNDYFLPVGYQEANPEIRDLCLDCISLKQRGIPLPNDEKVTITKEQDWF